MANVKKYKANDVVFGKNNTIILYMREFIYNNLGNVGKQHYKDKRNIENQKYKSQFARRL